MVVRGLMVACALAYLAFPYCVRMRHPYNFRAAVAIDEERIARFPGGAKGPDFSVVLESKGLPEARRLFEGRIFGAESIRVSEDKLRIVMLDKFGYVHVAVAPSAEKVGSFEDYVLEEKPRAYAGPGRPLGFEVVGDLIYVCDSIKGLVQVDIGRSPARIAVLANVDDEGAPFHYANDLDLSPDGKSVYFSSSTNVSVVLRDGTYDTMGAYLQNFLSGSAQGRLFKHELETGRTSTLVAGLAYANGVAVAADGSYVLCVETDGLRVMKHWLSGDRAGDTEELISALPGMPDGIARSPDGNFWVALVVKAGPLHKLVAPFPTLRTLLSHVILWLYPKLAKKFAGALKIDGKDGTVVDALFDLQGDRVNTLSAVVEDHGFLFLGNLAGNFVSILPYP